MSIERRVSENYARSGIAERTLAQAERLAATRLGVGSHRLSLGDIVSFDQLHIGGVAATLRFFRRLRIPPGSRWLDVGSGLGGTARCAVEAYRCFMTGIDLTPDFGAVAMRLTELTGWNRQVSFVTGNALAMPFSDVSFDGAITLHAAINIEDKSSLYREIARVLKPGATFAIYDILVGPTPGDLVFPVPWANRPDTSHLVDLETLCALLNDAGFEVADTVDRTPEALHFFADTERRQAEGEQGAPGLVSVMGEGYRRMVMNSHRNVAEGRTAPWEIHCRKRQ